jgi:transglutaminase-like putative cysteine protease
MTSRTALAALVACAIGAVGSQALAARLPDWAQSIADGAPPVGKGVHDTPFRILLHETRAKLDRDGRLMLHRRFASQALSFKAGELGLVGFPIREHARVTVSRAWHVPPGEKAQRTWGPPREISLGKNFLTDAKARVIPLSGVERGSLVFVEFEAEERPLALAWSHSFHETAPIDVARYELETPPGWTVRSSWLRLDGPDPAIDGAVRRWELRALPALAEEPLGDPTTNLAPRLVVNVLPPLGIPLEAAVFPDWSAMSVWWEDLARGRDAVTPEIALAAREVYAGAGEGFFDRVGAAVRYVRDRVRYVDVAIGIGGYQPRPASETLANLYGDCKDKTTLLRALLAAGGIRSYPIAVNSRVRETASSDLPAIDAFDHLVSGIPIPEGATLPAEVEAELTQGGDLGRLLVVDSTHEYLSVGAVGAHLAGKAALVVAGARGKLVTLAVGETSGNRTEHRLRVDWAADGGMRAEMSSTSHGESAADARYEYRRSAGDRREEAEERVLKSWPDAKAEQYEVVLETIDGGMVETVRWSVPHAAASRIRSAAPLFPGALHELREAPLTGRRSAVVYDRPILLRYETAIIGIGAPASLPEPIDRRGAGWAVSTTFAREDGTVLAVLSVALDRTRFAPDEFDELRRFWSAARAAAAARLRPASNERPDPPDPGAPVGAGVEPLRNPG